MPAVVVSPDRIHMAGTEQDSFIGGAALPDKLSQGFEIVFGKTGVGEPVIEAEGRGGQDKSIKKCKKESVKCKA